MSSTERDALATPLPGSQIYNTTLDCIDLYDGTSWDCIAQENEQSDNQRVTIKGDSLLLERGGRVDLSSFLDNTDNQQISSFTYNALTFELAITLEAGGTQFVDLSALNNSGTDDQQISISGNTLTLEDGGTVDLSKYLDNTDDQQITDFRINGNALTITLEDGGRQTVDLSAFEESEEITRLASDLEVHINSDEDTDRTKELINSATLNGNNLEIVDAGGTTSVNLSALNNAGTDDQQISDLSISGNRLSITLEDGGTKTVDLSVLDDSGSDNQALSLTGNTLNLSNGGTVDLTPFLDNTDDQNLTSATINGSNILTIAIEGGDPVTVDLSDYLDNTDEQDLTGATLTGTDLKIDIENGASVTADLSYLQSSITQVVSSGNTIATHNDGANNVNIIETITTLSQDDDSETGEITFTNESGVETTAQVVAAEPTNQITVGTNGGAFFVSPVRAMGKVNADGSTNKSPYNSSVEKTGVGVYLVTLDAAAGIADEDYIIQLTVKDSQGAGNDDYDISYRAQNTSSFIIEIGDNDNGASNRANTDYEFMFSVLSYDLPSAGGATPTGTEDLTGQMTVYNFADRNQNFTIQVGNTTNAPLNYEFIISNVPYSTIPSLDAGYTIASTDNGDGTFNHLITSSSPLPAFGVININGGALSPEGNSNGGQPTAPTTVTFYIL